MLLLIVDHRSDDIRGQQVGGELDPAELCVKGLSQRFDSQCFSESRDSFQEDVAIAEQADEQPVEHLVLSYDNTSYLIAQPVDKGGLVLDLTVQLSDILCCIKHNADII